MSAKINQIDENYIKNIFIEVNEHIENYQNDFNKDSDSFESWAKTICQPKFKLIKNFVYLLEQNDISPQQKQQIFFIINQLLIINPNLSKQLKNHNTLPQILIDYIKQFNKEYHKNDIYAVGTLSYAFKIENYKDLMNLDIINIIFDCLNKVKEENVITNIIKLFIDINYTYKDNNDLNSNIFLQVFNDNENSNLFVEVILKILNQEKDNDCIQKILYCIKCLMDIKKKDIFYSKDLETFLDIAINMLETTELNELRLGILNILNNLTIFGEIYNIKYKMKELEDLLDDCSNNDIVSTEVQEISKKVIDNLKNNLKHEV